MKMPLAVARRLLLLSILLAAAPALAQPLGEADSASPGDAMIQQYLARETLRLAAQFEGDVRSLDEWLAKRPQYIEEYFYMLGLSPRPEKTPLEPVITGKLAGDGYTVEMLHYQSRPGLYVTGNLYRPAEVEPNQKLPAVFYVCGHSARGRNGNKVAYQSHGIWFARHGYLCLVVDSLQLGEIGATHHGTYNLGRWWWHSRGYTPAGVEAWNGVRGIDYLASRDDVDPERIAVTGISGGGAVTFWIAALDERIAGATLVSPPPSHMAAGAPQLLNVLRVCDVPDVLGLLAPRPLAILASPADDFARTRAAYAAAGSAEKLSIE